MSHPQSFHYYSSMYNCNYCAECKNRQQDWFIIDLTAIDLSEIEITVKQAEQFWNTNLSKGVKGKNQAYINRLNYEYKKCLQINKDILLFIHLFLNNYQFHYSFYNVLKKNSHLKLSNQIQTQWTMINIIH